MSGAIQIVDTHETLEPRITIGVVADHRQMNRTLLTFLLKKAFR
jgi:hypothetical protein